MLIGVVIGVFSFVVIILLIGLIGVSGAINEDEEMKSLRTESELYNYRMNK